MSRYPRWPLLLAGYAAALMANLIHTNFSPDPAIAPATVLALAYWWRPHRTLHWFAALLIVLPSVLFLQWRALLEPGQTRFFLNHFCLLLAALLATASVIQSIRGSHTTAPNS